MQKEKKKLKAACSLILQSFMCFLEPVAPGIAMWLGQSHTRPGTCTTLLTAQSPHGRPLIRSGIFDSILCCLGDMIKLLLGSVFKYNLNGTF